MRSRTLFLCAVVLACAMLMLASCSSVGVYASSDSIATEKGPPAHAPAHGYRRKHQTMDVQLVYDSGRDVYVVVGLPGHYYYDGHFFRIRGAQWEMSLNTADGWQPADENSIPPGLRTKSNGNGKLKRAYSRLTP